MTMHINRTQLISAVVGYIATVGAAFVHLSCSDLPACDPHATVTLNARWISEATAACLEHRTVDDCPVWPSIAERYKLESPEPCAVASEIVVRETVNATLREIRARGALGARE